MEKKRGYIYKITNLLNRKIYIGYTQLETIQKRFEGHIENAETGDTALGNAIRKYGSENFKIEKVCSGIMTIEKLKDLEIYFIKKFESKDPKGYNLTDGGDGGWTFVDSVKKKHSNSLKRAAAEGRSKTIFKPGHSPSKEVRKKMSKAKQGGTSWAKGLTKETDERIKRISEKSQKTRKERGLNKPNSGSFRKGYRPEFYIDDSGIKRVKFIKINKHED